MPAYFLSQPYSLGKWFYPGKFNTVFLGCMIYIYLNKTRENSNVNVILDYFTYIIKHI